MKELRRANEILRKASAYCAGGASQNSWAPRQMVMAFIDDHAKELGIEPICRELQVAPSSYHEHAVRLADPDRRSARARRDDEIREDIRRVHEASFGLYGTRKSLPRRRPGSGINCDVRASRWPSAPWSG